MNVRIGKLIILAVVIAAAGGIVWAKQTQTASEVPPSTEVATSVQPQAAQTIPRLLDLGADKCVPCKMMKPILDGMREEYAGRMDVEFVDVWKDPAAAETYGINVIPTQIFFGTGGKELRRHQGFMSKEDILKTWKDLGVVFPAPSPEA